MKQVSLLVVGAGSRGVNYTDYIKEYPYEGLVAAVCEPKEDVRKKFADRFDVPQNMRFRDWRDILDKPKLADAALICTQDTEHKDPAIALSTKGYHLMLEKPMAPNPADCEAICEAAQNNGIMLAVCHVLRYTAFNRKLKEMIDVGAIGTIHSVQLLEPVGYWHQAHSYVRGNWRKEAQSSSMLLAKSCHDMDLLNYFIGKKCTRVSSFGNLSYFKKSNQPQGAADRCTDCPAEIESSCQYSAVRIYLRDRMDFLDKWPVRVITSDSTPEGVISALREGPYGRCVFACDNDVVDHQIVNLEFENGATASFTMCAFNPGSGREIYIMGDKGTLRCTDDGIKYADFVAGTECDVPLESNDIDSSGHGGGDFWLMKSFLAAVRNNDNSYIQSGPEISLASHKIVFAAEQARKSGTVISL